MKQAIVESAREVRGSMSAGGKNLKCVVKAAVKRKEDAWKQVLGARDEAAKEEEDLREMVGGSGMTLAGLLVRQVLGIDCGGWET